MKGRPRSNLPNEDFLLNGPIRNLSRIFRYSSMALHEQENVAEHNFWVSWYSMQIAHWVESAYSHIDFNLDWQLIYELSITHDFAECFTGDMIRPVKYSSEEFLDAYKGLEAAAEHELMKVLPEPVAHAVAAAWVAESQHKDILEVRIVKMADLLSVWGKMVEEDKVGNGYARGRIELFIRNYFSLWKNDDFLGPLFTKIIDSGEIERRQDQPDLEGFPWSR